MQYRRNWLSIKLAATVVFAGQLQAQVLEEVVVTATKRAKSLQDVPISMLAMSGDSIKDMAVTRGEEFTANMPAITIAQNPIGNFIFIRGIGTSGVNQGLEQSVSLFHDGIYMGRSQLSRAPFMDLERVEVLRGPQSILFGKNTIGGAIHVISAKPTDEFEGMISALYGWEDGETEITGVLSGPITNTLSGRISFRGYELDGYLKNIMNDKFGPQRDDRTLRLQLAWDATDNLSFLAKWEKSKFEQTSQATQIGLFDPTGSGVGFSALNAALVALGSGGDGAEEWDYERAVANDGGMLLGQLLPAYADLPGFPDKPELSDNEMDVGTLTMEWGLGDHTLIAITGIASYQYRDICDCDFSALPLIEVDATEEYDQFSQEIRLSSPGGQTLDYIVGAYYQQSDLAYRSIEAIGTSLAAPLLGAPPSLTPNLTRDYTMDQDQDMWAIFGSATFSFTDTRRLTFGLRYFEENKDVVHILDEKFTDGWDYSSAVGLPAGTLTYGDSAEEYDRFLNDFAGTPLTAISEGLFSGLLGTFEHNIRRSRKEKDWNWSVTLEQDLGEDTMVFGTVSTGTKGGGFDARFLKRNSDPFFEYEQEKALIYELGVKTYLLDGRMSLNATAFYTTVKDYQVSIFDGATGFFVQNAAEIRSQGLELDISWAATDELTMGLSGSYLDSEYSDFPNAPCWTVSGTEPVNRGNCIGRGTPIAFRDATGDTNIFSPKWASNLSFDYRRPVSPSLEVRVILNINYTGDYFSAADLDPIYATQKAFTKYDARVSLGELDGKWDVALIGKNLTNEFASGTVNDQPLVPGNRFTLTDRLRSYAIQVSYRF